MNDELISVRSFALRYRVDASIIRAWIKRGAIPYELVGPRKMRLKPSAMLKFIQPTAIIGKFEDYPTSDNYMRMSNEQRTSDQESTVGGPQAATGGDIERTGRLAPLPKVPRGSRRTA